MLIFSILILIHVSLSPQLSRESPHRNYLTQQNIFCQQSIVTFHPQHQRFPLRDWALSGRSDEIPATKYQIAPRKTKYFRFRLSEISSSSHFLYLLTFHTPIHWLSPAYRFHCSSLRNLPYLSCHILKMQRLLGYFTAKMFCFPKNALLGIFARLYTYLQLYIYTLPDKSIWPTSKIYFSP